jgi:predicted ATP-dependent endonuclease of OLD family
MYITQIRIRNFRNFLKGRFVLKQGVNTLIGENGSGKTNVLQAVRFLLDENLSRNATTLKDTDFCRDLGQWRGHWIIISADFANLDPSDGCQTLRHMAAHMNGTNSGTFSFIFRPKKEVRKQLHELSENEPDKLDSYLSSITTDDYEPVLTGRGCGDYLDDAEYHAIAGNPKTKEFPDPDDDNQERIGVRVGPIYQEVACTFVTALRDVVTELRGYRSNPLLTLLRGMGTEIKIQDADSIVQKVNELNSDISGLREIKKLATGIEDALRKTVGLTYGPGVSIESALPNSLEKILQRLNVLVGDQQHSTYRGEIQEQSLGGANLIYLALKLLEYELKLSSDRVAHFLLIEEPEAHIHTHIQKTLFSNLPSESTQIIVSTHSTHISSASRIASVNVLAKQNDHVEVYYPANDLDEPTIARVERYLDAIRSTMLFAKGVLLVEGDAEQILIPAMLNAVFGISPDQLGFSIVSMNSAFFEHISILFSENRIRRPCAIVTDRDKPIFELPEDPDDDDKVQAHARAADEAGLARQKKLEEVKGENPWLETFFSNHTFEVDFLTADNAHEVIAVLPKIFTQQAAIASSKSQLGNDDVAVYGKEILRLAKKEGKGWFALLLADFLTDSTYFPEYILRAVAFACHISVTDSALRQIALFRMKKNMDLATKLRGIEGYDGLSAEEFLQHFCAEEPYDDLTLFYGYIKEYQLG